MQPSFNNRAQKKAASLSEAAAPEQALYAAIETDDVYALQAALAAGAHPDIDGGRPLRLCAAQGKYPLAKTLALGGADIGYALLQARRENEAIPRRTETGMILTFRIPKTEEGKKREAELTHEIARLEEFQKVFIETALPMEQMNLLHEVRAAQYDLSRRMDAMEKALRDIDKPRPLENKSAAKPAAPGLGKKR